MKKKAVLLCCLVLLAGSIAACGSDGKSETQTEPQKEAASESSEAELSIKWGSQNNPVMASGKTSLFTVEEIERLSEGKITVDYYDQGQLGYDAELIQQVIEGTIPAVTIGISAFGPYTETLDAIQLPFLITDYETEYKVVRSEEFLSLLDEAGKELGLKIIGTQENGIRHFANNINPINTVADMSGMKIRVPQTNILMETIEALGANPVPLAYNEVYTALQNNVVDGEEINLTSIEAQRHYEVVKYVSKIGFYPYMAVTAINLEFWDSLSEEQQSVIEEALTTAEEKCFTGWIQENDESAETVSVEQGVEINEISDVDSFRDAVSSVYEEYKEKSDSIKAFIESVEAVN